MSRYRATIRRVVIDHEVIEFDADGIQSAAQRARGYVDGNSRGIVIVRSREDDPKQQTADQVTVLVEQQKR